ncbi:competence/damage-inducible protein A [Proteinivorax hydrogeniformans]|uniref:Putative competence-damage inducible protein n=1 Tax=Proteinivorax hydrogeniformans TaxID=1826727 RepID=A0AAU8HNQ8_9FIRM
MKSEIINVGSEILLGDILNTNAKYLSSKLNEYGFSIYYQTSVGDNADRLKSILSLALNRSDFIFVSGGLGPTQDDITREVTSDLLGLPLELCDELAEEIGSFFEERGIKMPQNNLRQAKVPKGAKILKNSSGTAPGLLIEQNNKNIVLLPGPPHELKAVLEESLLPLKMFSLAKPILSTTVKTYGIGESQLVEEIEDILNNQTNPTIAPLAKDDGVHLRLTYKGDHKKAKEHFSKYKDLLNERVGSYIWGYDSQELNEIIIDTCIDKKLKISTVESCTAGAIASVLTDVSGSSKVFTGGNVVYTEGAKKEFLQSQEDIKNGGVEQNLTDKLAERLYHNTGSDVCIAITGALGPSSPHVDVSVGEIYISTLVMKNLKSHKFKFKGSRETIKKRAVLSALFCILKELKKTN